MGQKKMLIDQTGNRFGRLVVIGRGSQSSDNRVRWLCQCDCGNFIEIRADHVTKAKSCGCIRMEKNIDRFQKHGESRTPLYRVRSRMLQCCENPKNANYHTYGGKGVKVCEEWHDFVKFKEWAEANGYKKGLHLHRIDENGDYCPENCVWMDKNSHERLHGEKHAYKIQMLDDDGNVLETFNRQGEIFEKYGFDLGSIRRSIRTGYRTKGYYWRRIKE